MPLQLDQGVNQVWSMDFVSDSLANGCRIKFLAVADDFGHERHHRGLGHLRPVRDPAIGSRGQLPRLPTDHGPEFISRAFMAWAQSNGVRHILIEPGRPMQNGCIETFNGKFKDVFLNERWFVTLRQARGATAIWRQNYNEVRPRGSTGRIPLARFAKLHRQWAGDAARSNSTATQIA